MSKQHEGKLIRYFHKRLFVVTSRAEKCDVQCGALGSIHDHILGRAVLVRGVGPLKDSATYSRKDSDFNKGINSFIDAKRQFSNLLKVLLHFLMRHGSTLSIIPRSELERIEKRGLEVRG